MTNVNILDEELYSEEKLEEEFALMIIESVDATDEEKKSKIKILARKIADKFSSYKEKAVELLKDSEGLDKLLEQIEKKMQKLGAKGEDIVYIPEMVMLIRSYIIKEYTDISLAKIVLIMAALIYYVSPLDVIPDSIPFVGLLDDAIVAKTVMLWCDEEIDQYMEWRKTK